MHNKTTYFQSLSEIVQRLKTQKRNNALHVYECHSLKVDGSFNAFSQTKTIEEAFTLATFGWKEGRNIITKLTKEYNDVILKLFPTQEWSTILNPSISGEIVNIEAALTNQPETMLHFAEDEEKVQLLSSGKMQRIIVNAGFTSAINVDTIFNRGAIIGCIINSMELAGFRTELYMTHPRVGDWGNGDIRVTYNTKIKSFNEDLDLGLLAFCLCHPSVNRRLIFGLLEQEREDWIIDKIVHCNYGRSSDLFSEDEIINFCSAFGANFSYGNIYFNIIKCNRPFEELLTEAKRVVQKHFTQIIIN